MSKGPNAVGARIQLIRQGRGLSQIKLAELVGVSYQQIQKYEKGATRLSIDRLEQIAGALGVPVAVFLREPDRVVETPTPYGELSKNERELLSLWRQIDNDALKAALLNLVRRFPRGR